MININKPTHTFLQPHEGNSYIIIHNTIYYLDYILYYKIIDNMSYGIENIIECDTIELWFKIDLLKCYCKNDTKEFLDMMYNNGYSIQFNSFIYHSVYRTL